MSTRRRVVLGTTFWTGEPAKFRPRVLLWTSDDGANASIDEAVQLSTAEAMTLARRLLLLADRLALRAYKRRRTGVIDEERRSDLELCELFV